MPLSQQAAVGSSPKEELVVRLVSIDYYMTRPAPGLDECYSQLEGSAIDQVPVIRIFGSTPSGQKTCVHVHGVSSRLLRAISIQHCPRRLYYGTFKTCVNWECIAGIPLPVHPHRLWPSRDYC